MPTVLQMTRKLDAPPETVARPDVRLRNLESPADIEAWLELRSRSFARQKLGVRNWTAEDFAAEFVEKPWWNPQAMWFAELAGDLASPPQIVGSITLAWRGEPLVGKPVVHWLMVAPRLRRHGIGRVLLSALETRVWELGHRQLWLETHAAWTEAAAFYQAIGFENVVGTLRVP